MNDKDEKLSNEVLHENKPLTPYDTPTSKRTLISSTGERKTSKHIYSPPNEASEEASNLISKRNIKESPRGIDQGSNYNIDVTSTYALQISLKSMKERYQKLQKKISYLEEENGRLINGKSDLYTEIGKMQESSIKLREKNLQLNHEVHSKHQECCSLQEHFSNVSNDNLKLSAKLSQSGNEKKKLVKEISELTKDNTLLREGLEEILSQCKRFSTIQPEILAQIERIANRSLKKNPLDYLMKMKIVPQQDLDDLDDFEKVSFPIDDLSFASLTLDETKDTESLSFDMCVKAKERMRKIASILQAQNKHLNDLKPSIINMNKRKLDSMDVDDSGDQCRNYLSRLATCGSGRLLSGANSSSEDALGAINDSGGETNVLVEEIIERGKKVPFDWRKVEVSDDEINDSGTSSRPEMRTVSTSPDLTLTLDMNTRPDSRHHSTDEDRTCPMCNAVFPLVLSQETFESHVVSHFEAENGFEVIS